MAKLTFEQKEGIILKVHRYVAVIMVFLTIGIPSVKRAIGPVYLMNTLQSVIDQTSPADKQRVVVLIFLSDEDTAYNQQVDKSIAEKFSQHLNSGFFQVIQADKSLYPPLSVSKRNYGDTLQRVRWRSKQVADFSLMFKYAANLSQYYIQIEDDIKCVNQFVVHIDSFIKTQSQVQWSVLEFSPLGFIGKLFKNEDLEKLSVFMLTFYQEQPVDWLIDYFRMTMVQKNKILRKPPLFLHVGKKSSFAGNKDRKVQGAVPQAQIQTAKIRNSNPNAQVVSHMKAFQQNTAENAYLYSNAFFWAVDVTKNDTLNIVFEKDMLVSSVMVKTGNTNTPNDVLRIGSVLLCPKVDKLDLDNLEVRCNTMDLLGSLKDGFFKMEHIEKSHSATTKCLVIRVDADQKDWVIFDTIEVKAVS